MATANRPPIRSAAEFEHGLSEVERLLEAPPPPESLEDMWFNHLLHQLAEFHETQPVARQLASTDRLQDLDRQLQAYGKRWPTTQGEEHWSPLLGGDLDPSHHRH